jgi:crotonobetainyl-CoA:carnitine CoA-transferase CaiB-like acyl-CoA transferase
MERLGLGYDALRRVKPDIIQASIKMYGNDGPLGYQTGYAPCFAALGGLNHLVGYEGEPPLGMNIRYGDSTVGAAAAFACVAALHHRATTGQGQFIDVSAVETMSSLVGDSLFAYALTGVIPQADGNSHADMAPHGVHPCADGEWLSIAVANDDEWRALAEVLDLDAASFAALETRLAERRPLDARIAAKTRARNASALAETLRARGVAAFRSQSSLDLVGDDLLWSRGAFRQVTDALGRGRAVIGPSWRMSPDDATIERGAPLLGEHNEHVYCRILGLSREALADLIARKVVD